MTHLFLADVAHTIMDLFVANKDIILFVVIGLVAGLIAQFVIPGKGYGLIATALIGIGGNALSYFFIAPHLAILEAGFLRNMAGAILGAIVVQLAFNLLRAQLPQKAKAK